jgi:hypothetical protein
LALEGTEMAVEGVRVHAVDAAAVAPA